MNTQNTNIVHYKIGISEILNMSEFQNNNIKETEDLTYKIKVEENIKIIKEEIYKLFDKNFKNKNDIEKIIENLEKINNDIDEFKKITNERIEKIFKLLMITNEKLVKLGV
mgnify:CR=1 FL=1